MIAMPRTLWMFAALAGLPGTAPMRSSLPTLAPVVVRRAPRLSADSLLISAAQLRQRLPGGGLVLLHVGERAEYDAGHIPGARFLPYDAIATRERDGLVLELPPPQTLDSLLESLGVSDGSRIVLYWGKDWFSPTTRVFLTLDYLGLGDRTSMTAAHSSRVRRWRRCSTAPVPRRGNASSGTVTSANRRPSCTSLPGSSAETHGCTMVRGMSGVASPTTRSRRAPAVETPRR